MLEIGLVTTNKNICTNCLDISHKGSIMDLVTMIKGDEMNIDSMIDERKIDKKFINFFKKKIRIIPRNKMINYLIKSKNKRNKFFVDLLTCSIFYQKLLENLQIPYICKLDPIYFLKSIV